MLMPAARTLVLILRPGGRFGVLRGILAGFFIDTSLSSGSGERLVVLKLHARRAHLGLDLETGWPLGVRRVVLHLHAASADLGLDLEAKWPLRGIHRFHH